jgi:hypothetical protein
VEAEILRIIVDNSCTTMGCDINRYISMLHQTSEECVHRISQVFFTLKKLLALKLFRRFPNVLMFRSAKELSFTIFNALVEFYKTKI